MLNEWAIRVGGHVRTGLEDNVRLDRDQLAPSNAALVRRAVELCERFARPVATPAQARAILGLRGVAGSAAGEAAQVGLLIRCRGAERLTVGRHGDSRRGRHPGALAGSAWRFRREGLTFAPNNAGLDDAGIGILLQTRQVTKVIPTNVCEKADFKRP